MILYEGGSDIPVRPNQSYVYKNGTTWETINCGTVTVIAKVDGDGKDNYYIVMFEDGTKIKTSGDSLSKRSIKNPNHPSVYGIGFIGQGHFSTGTKEYCLWKGMFKRCYNKQYQIENPTYEDCTVDKRWHNFQNFCEDIQHLEGYGSWCKDTFHIHLDKDCAVKGNKVYSFTNCRFVNVKINNSIENRTRRLTGYIYEAIRIKDGYKEEFISQREFAKKYDLYSSSINFCIKGKMKKHKGWKFKTKI